MPFQKGHKINSKPSTKVEVPLPEVEEPNYYNAEGYLPQKDHAFTALAVVRIADGAWVLRQTDIINGKIVKTEDSKPNARACVFEYYKTAAADLFYKEHP